MEQNTIQIQHINLECPIAEFGFNRFLLTFFIRYRVLNSNAFRPGIGPQGIGPLGLQPCSSITSGSPNCWTSNRPAWSKIEGRLAHVKKVLKFINQKSSKFSWVVSQTRVLQRSNTRAIFHKVFIDIVSICVIFSLAARTVQRSSNILLPLFPLGPWYRMFSQCVLLCLLCACSFFKLPLCDFSLHTRLLTHYVTLHSTMYQKTHQLQLIALYSQQAL